MVTPCIECGRLVPVGSGGRCRLHELEPRSIRRTPAYRALRRAVLAAAGGRCAVCGRSGVPLELGHRLPMADHPELALDPGNVEAQCRDCNERPGPRRRA